MKANTREKLLEQAERLFAEKGFYGASINDIAKQVGVSKQGLLHHFPTKEKLYAAVLQQAADFITQFINDLVAQVEDESTHLIIIFEELVNADGRLYEVIVLLMRELLDNQKRVIDAHQWFLRPFLNRLVSIADAAKVASAKNSKDSLSLVYYLLGATQYFLISQPTLKQIYSKTEFQTLANNQRELIRTLCREHL